MLKRRNILSRTFVGIGCAIALASNACYTTLPPQLAEGTTVLERGQANVTFAGGGGAFVANCCASGKGVTEAAAGLEARVRVGVGAKSEVGASFVGGMGTSVANGDPPFAIGGKLSYKVAPTPWLAFVADGGVMDMNVASVAVFSGTLAAILAPYTAQNGTQLYTGVRGGFAIPVLQGARNVNEMLSIPVGLALATSERVRFFVEGGFIAGFAQQTADAGGPASTAASFGGYGALALAYRFR